MPLPASDRPGYPSERMLLWVAEQVDQCVQGIQKQLSSMITVPEKMYSTLSGKCTLRYEGGICPVTLGLGEQESITPLRPVTPIS